MAARRRGGDTLRWRAVVALEVIKALCRAVLVRVSGGRAVVGPLPEREAVVPDEEEEENGGKDGEWNMPRTQSVLPPLPPATDIQTYLLSRVLTSDDIKPAAALLPALRGPSQTAEMLHILAPVVYASALAAAPPGARRGWVPWAAGLAVEYAARQVHSGRDEGVGGTALEREEWGRRGWGMVWWGMRGPVYDGVVKGVLEGVRRRVPGFVGGVVEDYEFLWENYYFSTAAM